MTAPMPPQGQPQAPPQPLQPPVEPWHPFKARPNDNEPPIATLWMKRLSKVMSTTKFSQMPPEWQAPLVQKYQQAVHVLQQMAAAQAPPPKPVGGRQPTQATQATQPAQMTGAIGGVPG